MAIHMKQTKKGVTLIEVIVAITVFAVISLVLFSSVIAMNNVIARQEEYVKLEMVCHDMNAYLEKYAEEWCSKYFGGEVNGEGYLSSDFAPTTNESEASYIIEFSESENVLTISIHSIDEQTTFVENVILPIKEATDEE